MIALLYWLVVEGRLMGMNVDPRKGHSSQHLGICPYDWGTLRWQSYSHMYCAMGDCILDCHGKTQLWFPWWGLSSWCHKGLHIVHPGSFKIKNWAARHLHKPMVSGHGKKQSTFWYKCLLCIYRVMVSPGAHQHPVQYVMALLTSGSSWLYRWESGRRHDMRSTTYLFVISQEFRRFHDYTFVCHNGE